MKVLKGTGTGNVFTYSDAELTQDEGLTNILVGREDVESKAHWRLSKEDLYVSRTHFMLEIRPPNCLLRDPQSLNGTYLIRKGETEKRVDEVLLQDGDSLRIGHTLLGFEIESEQANKTIKNEVVPVEKLEPFVTYIIEPSARKSADLMCIRCGEKLESLPSMVDQNLRNLDFMCAKCRVIVERQLQAAAQKESGTVYRCGGKDCSQEISTQADADGRAAELAEVCSYLCESCAWKATHQYYRDNPREINGYSILKQLGEGGMGEVFKVRHNQTGRVAALKRLKPIIKSDERQLRRFHREISMMQGLVHPHLVRLFEAGQEGDAPFFVSEFVTGGDFSQFIGDDGSPTLDHEQAVQYITDSLVGLEFFHQAKFVHRDLKPENLLLMRNEGLGIPKVADFGLGKCYEKYGGSTTRLGEFAGTWMYMPPEQITDFKYCRPPVDVYAMGVTLYYLLSGCSPLPNFPAPWEIKQKPGQIRLQKDPIKIILYDARIPLADQAHGIPHRLCQVVDKALAMDAKQRYPSALALREALLEVV